MRTLQATGKGRQPAALFMLQGSGFDLYSASALIARQKVYPWADGAVIKVICRSSPSGDLQPKLQSAVIHSLSCALLPSKWVTVASVVGGMLKKGPVTGQV